MKPAMIGKGELVGDWTAICGRCGAIAKIGLRHDRGAAREALHDRGWAIKYAGPEGPNWRCPDCLKSRGGGPMSGGLIALAILAGLWWGIERVGDWGMGR